MLFHVLFDWNLKVCQSIRTTETHFDPSMYCSIFVCAPISPRRDMAMDYVFFIEPKDH